MQQQFTVLLNSLKTCSASMLECLASEQIGLASRNLEQIEQTTQRKLDLTREMEKLENQRVTLVTSLGHKNDSAGMMACIQQQPNAGLLARLWQDILDNLAACRDCNLTNGGILALGRRQAEQALSILCGQHSSPGLYSQEGDTSPGYGNRHLGKA